MKHSKINLGVFKVFYDLTETKSFSQAAVRNSITQSAVSQQISFLEKATGKRLMERGKGKFSLTEEGQVFLEGCRNILNAYQGLLDSLNRNHAELTGTVKVETVYSIGLHQLPSYVSAFMRRHPQVNLHIEYNRSDRIYTDVINYACDMGIVAYPWTSPSIDVIPFKKEKLALVCPPDHPLAANKTVKLKDLKHRNFVAFERNIPTGEAIDKILRKFRVLVHITHEFDNIETLKRSVEVGSGVSILPDMTVSQEVKNKTLVSIPIKEGPFYRPLAIIRRKGRKLSKASDEFIQWLCAKGVGKK